MDAQVKVWTFNNFENMYRNTTEACGVAYVLQPSLVRGLFNEDVVF